jgi:hypothetical protein
MSLFIRFVSCSAALLFGISPLIPTHSAWAWGRIEHRASARAAFSKLTPAALSAIRDLLEPGETLADAATWPDEHRSEFPESGPWHYVNVPIDEPKFDRRFCPQKGCVVDKIEEFRRKLADETLPKTERKLALRYLVHFIQDVHQPVHVGHRNDRGGNDLQLQFFNNPTNLHRIWDYQLLEKENDDEDRLVNDLRTAIARTEAERWTGKSVDEWATESLLAARSAYERPGSTERLKAGEKLGAAYYEANLPAAKRRLAQATARVVETLNHIWP